MPEVSDWPAANLLGDETSPYLQQHRDNPVHWRPWGPEALAEAAETDKPILLSVGYAACHWCHVMAHESFEDPETAEVMNAHFINVKVDREERPDIDGIYMSALHAFGEQGGWPMTMFLGPDGKPFWGGTYFPPESRWGRPSFRTVLAEIDRLYREDRAKLDNNREIVTRRLAETAASGAGEPITMDTIDQMANALIGVMDSRNGGTQGAPKFPQFALFELIARHGLRHRDERYIRIFVETLQHIFEGGIYDHLAGGLARYAVDEIWLVPHFEKMLYDNARAIDALVLGHQISGLPLFRRRIEEIIAWLDAEMLTEDGAYAASLDADSEGEEGKFYVWTKAEIEEALGLERSEAFCAYYAITDAGNWEGKTILNRLHAPAGFDPTEVARFDKDRRQLLAIRERRIRPGRDDKILTDWNALAIAAIAQAGIVLARPDWIESAEAIYRAVAATAPSPGKLLHSHRGGKPGAEGLAADYADMARAATTLHEVTQDAAYLDDARLWLETLDSDFSDGKGGYYLAPAEASDLIIRPRAAADDPMPAANAVILETLARLECFTGNTEFGERAARLARAFSGAATEQPFAHAYFLNAAERAIRPLEIVIVGSEPADAADALARIAWDAAMPTKCVTISTSIAALPPGHPASGRPEPEVPTAYICENRTCSVPITDPAEFAKSLKSRH